MEIANTILGQKITEAIGWFIIHSLWQGVLIALLLFITLYIFKRSSARLRYYLSFFALLMLVIFSGITFQKSLSYASEKVELKQAIVNNPEYLTEYIMDNQENLQNNEPDKTSATFNPNRVQRRAAIQKHFSWIVGIWIIGLVFYLLKILFALVSQFYLFRSGREKIDNTWIRKIEEFATRLKIKREIGMFLSSRIKSPITTGFLKPVILVPASLISGLEPEQIEAIIAHELAHIKRNDYIINILQTLIETLFFFHPAVWYITAQIRKERENACDDIAIELTSDKVNYAKALTIAEEFIISQGKFAMAFSPFRQSLLQRIKRLNTKITMKTKLNEKLIAGLIILSGFVFLSFILDTDYSLLKHDISSDETLVDTTLGKDKIVIQETTTDSEGNETVTKRVYKTREDDLDSLIAVMEECGDLDKELEKIVEIAMLDDDDLFSEEIFHCIHMALEDMDIDMIVSDAMTAAQEGIKAAEEAMKNEQIHLKICESMNKEFTDSLSEETRIIVMESLEEACRELEGLDINLIIADALKEANEALKEIDMDIIITEALEEARKEIEEEHRHVIKIKTELHEEEKDLAEKEQELIEREEELKEELEQLEKELKEVKKRQKEETKK